MSEPIHPDDAHAAAIERYRGSAHEIIIHARRLNEAIASDVQAGTTDFFGDCIDCLNHCLLSVNRDMVAEFGEPGPDVETIDDVRQRLSLLAIEVCMVLKGSWFIPLVAGQRLERAVLTHSPKTYEREFPRRAELLETTHASH